MLHSRIAISHSQFRPAGGLASVITTQRVAPPIDKPKVIDNGIKKSVCKQRRGHELLHGAAYTVFQG